MSESAKERSKVLVVAGYVPYPPNHGAALDTWKRIETLRELGFDIDLIATGMSAPDDECFAAIRERVREFTYVPRSRGLREVLALRPFQVESRRRLRNLAVKAQYDCVLLESEYVSSILENESLVSKHFVLRVHNDEERYFRELAKTCRSWLAKCFYLAEAAKFRFYSRHVMARCEQLWFISEFERARHVQAHPADAAKSVFLPPRMDVPDRGEKQMRGGSVLFVGGLNIPMNIAGVTWYLTQVHPRLRGTDGYRFVIAGLTQGKSTSWLDELCKTYPDIELHRDVPELGELYRDAAIFVNPVFSGAGLKLKTVEAIEAGLPVVSTRVGAEGTGLVDKVHLLIAESADSFAAAIRNLLREKELGKALVRTARSYIAEAYDQRRIMKQCLENLLGCQALSGSDGVEPQAANTGSKAFR